MIRLFPLLRRRDTCVCPLSQKVSLFRGLLLAGTSVFAMHVAYADVSGAVFRDLNANGTQDTGEVGVPGITVKAYDSTGTVVGAATSAINGTYTLSGLTGDLRIEFTGAPAYLYPGATGTVATDSQSGVQFVTAGAATTVNYALSYPAEYCNASPRLMAPIYINGAVTGAGLVNVLQSWPYANTGEVATGLVTNASKADLGSIWGVAYKRSSKEAFTSAVLKRHVGVKDADGDGIPDLGAIYKTDTNTNTTSLFIKIPNAGSIGTDAVRGLGDSGTGSADPAALGQVMKTGLGDVDISEDEKYLYVTNLNDKKLYQVDIAQQSITNSYSIPDPCNSAKGNSRPFGIGVYQGNVYVGLVCDASVTGLKADLQTYVERLNANGSFTQVLQSSLDFNKQPAAAIANPDRAGWYGWSDDYNTISLVYGGERRIVYPQPVLSDINFDKNGNMILGFIDRAGFQGGYRNTAPTTMPTTGVSEFITMNGGDLLRAVSSGGIWILGLDDFYNDNSPVTEHMESALGGVCYNALNDQVLSTVMDPLTYYQSGGTVNINNATGARNSAYQLYHLEDVPDLFSKGSGLGDLELLCDSAPIEIGNRVWLDADNDGIQDAGETGISGVTVKLMSGATEIASAVTAADGTYHFTNAAGATTTSSIYGLTRLQPGSAYTIQLPTTVDISGITYHLTQAQAGSNTETDSNADTSGVVVVAAADIPVAGANNYSFDIGYIAATDLKLNKTVSPSTVTRGGTAIYTLTVTNESNVDAAGVQVKDSLPARLTLVSSHASQGTFTGGIWNVGTLPANTTATLTITVTVN